MAFAHSKNSRVLVNELSASGHITGYTLNHTRALGETTTLADEGCKYIPGLMGGSLALRGLFDSAATSLHTEALSTIGTDNALLVTAFPDGFTIGSPAFLAVCDTSGYVVDASVSETVTIAIEGTPDDGVDWGVSLHALGAETADTNSASVDNTASSANGGVATLHVTAYSGLTDAVVKVQHSTDDSTWADLITFTTVTAATSERKTVTGTVNRYLRATVDVTGTGSVTFAVAFARR